MRALLRLTTLGDREFTLYLLDLFKMADRQRVGAITAQNRRMALAFLNLELERATESTLMTSLDLDNSGALDFRPCRCHIYACGLDRPAGAGHRLPRRR